MKRKLTLLFLLAFVFISFGCPPTPPPDIDPPDIDPPVPPPVIEYVYVDTCIDSGFMRNTFCPDDRIKFNKKYVKGTEPLSWCAFHKEPTPPIPLPEKFEEYHIHWIGLLSWMMAHPEENVDVLIEKTRRTGASCVHSFAWVGEDYFLKETPWEWIGDKIDFTKLNTDYRFQFKRLAQLCKDNDMDFMPILFMSRYNFKLFTTAWNVNGIEDFYSPEALEIQKTYVVWCLTLLKEVYGNDYKPTVQLINEPAHTDDESAHQIADWHREVGDLVLQYTDKGRLWFDSSHSEYVHAWFVGPQPCPKCGRMLGRVEFSDRPCISESHGCSTLEGFKSNNIDAFFGSAWTHGACNEDGSDSGSKLCDGISSFRQANTAEYTTALKYVMDNQGDKKAYIVSFPFDPIKNAMEDYTEAFVLTYDWERLMVYSILHKSK